MSDGGRAGPAVRAASTVGEALRAAARALEAAGVPEPRREAEQLYAALVRGATSAAWAERERTLAPEGVRFLAQAVARRAAGWPQAYAAGWANFRGHWLRVDPRVLIPRPETEGLVEVVLAWVRGRAPLPRSAGLVAADVGTGTGAIAASLALEGPFGFVYALDRSAAALELARANVAALGLGARVRCLRGDLLGPLASRALDVVVSNPPYLATAELAELEASVRAFEPSLALDGGPDGLGPTRRLVAAAREAVGAGGLLAVEADARRAGETAALVRDAGFVDVAVLNDLFERPRYVTALQPGAR
jgi:release factor glutamine methyltransferase